MGLDVLQKVVIFIRKNSLLTKDDKLVVGVSGGPDSLCLLHLLVHHLSYEFELPPPIVAHLNHELRGSASQADADFVQEIAARWQLPFFSETKEVAKLANERKQSIEETARQVRYAFLWQVAIETGAHKIMVGHNADDQVETILMHFLRGSGLAGLRGMTPEVDLASLRLQPDDIRVNRREEGATVKLIRPLLEVSRFEIEAYCQANGLLPRQDDSNQDVTFFRNRLRYELIPQLETYNPNIREVLRRTARVVTAEVDFLNDQLDHLWPSLIRRELPQGVEFELQHWLNLPLALKRSSLRRAIQTLRQGLRDINFDHIEAAIDLLERGETGTQATLPQGLMLTVSYRSFIIAPEALLLDQTFQGPRLDKGEVLSVNIPGLTQLPKTGWALMASSLSVEQLSLVELQQVGSWELYLDAGVFGSQTILRSRRPGDKFHPLGMGGRTKKINEFMIDKKIPGNWRDHIPLLVSDQHILWICGYRPDEQARVTDATRQVVHLKFEYINSNKDRLQDMSG